MLKEHLPAISRIIMRLCLNNENMGIFIEQMRSMVRKLAELSLTKIKDMVKADSIEEGNKEHLKIVNLMNIFFEMVSSFTTYPNPDQEYHAAGLVELRKIV